ncbi:hypothetical protein EV356DRAFT_507338 [Viridothelium virens]|uniref:J domain-containing protein n=1 Tax=Viridothelium virens TaxID=1048519 RepID=A0A6A6HJN4_VIRVR|nr:hypothetical protein EV356DRAFT_507338 [Viridothelium virens]
MVKPDVKKNYYADLELPPDSSVDDVRKQYRKLALKYHPDRNSGKEAECVPKFQAIQAAFEVLSDSDLKAKYDADRRKASLYPRPSARPGPTYPNTFTSTSARTASFRPSPSSPQDNYSANSANLNGAFRYTNANFPRPQAGGGPPRRENPQEKADAWTRMNHARQQGGSTRRAEANPPPPPPRSGGPGGPPRSPWGHKDETTQPKPAMGRSNTVRTPRSGFDPQHSRADERQASGTSAYAHHAFHPQRPTVERRQTADFPPPPPSAGAPPKTAPPYTHEKPDPFRPFRSRYSEEDVPFAEGTPRPRMPYTSSTGERTYLSNEAMRRSASTRDPSSRPGSSHRARHAEGFDGYQARHRSASPAANRKAYTSSQTSEGSSDGGDQGAQFMGPAAASQQPPRPHARSSDPEISATTSSSRNDNHSNATGAENRKAAPTSAWRGRSGQFPQNDGQGVTGSANDNAPNAMNHGTKQDDTSDIFTIPIEKDTFAPTRPDAPRSRSHEHMRFSPSDWQGKFTGSADYFEARPSSQKQRKSPTKGPDASKQRGHSTDASIGQMPPPPPGPPPQPQHAPTKDDVSASQPGEGKFSAEQWQNQFSEPNWAYPAEKPPSPTRATSRSRPSGRKQSTAKAKTPVVPKAAKVGGAVEEEPDSDAKHDSGAASASSSSLKGTEGDGDADGDADGDGADDQEGDAMDIDQETSASPTSQPQEPRFIPVHPVRPEVNINAPNNATHTRHASHPISLQQNQPRHVKQLSAGGALKTNLSDLAAAAPFGAAGSSGLQSVSDLGANLPFESKPSTSHPTKSFTPRNFDLPLPPKPPSVPTGRPTRANWEACLAGMTSYMKDWSIFYKTIIDHFNARSTALQQLTNSFAAPLTPTVSSTGTGATSNWLAATGETTGAPGFDTYLQGLREDERVRQHWNSSCEKHRETLEKFHHLREKVRGQGGGG